MSEQGSTAGDSAVATAQQTKPAGETRRKRQPQYHVILWDDDQHSYDYVEQMMLKLFGHTQAMGHKIALKVDSAGRAVCLTTTREHAELKRDQIHAYGPDALIQTCASSMKATIEPVPGD